MSYAHYMAFLMLALAFVAHCREMIVQNNYHRDSKGALWMFMLDPLTVLVSVLILKDELLASTAGSIVFYGNIAEVVLHLGLFAHHFGRRPMLVRWSLVHNSIDAFFLAGAVMIVTPSFSSAQVSAAWVMSVVLAYFGLPLLETLVPPSRRSARASVDAGLPGGPAPVSPPVLTAVGCVNPIQEGNHDHVPT